MPAASHLRYSTRGSPTRNAGRPDLTTAILVLDHGRRVEFASNGAKALFAPLNPLGRRLPALLGHLGASDGDPVLAGLAAGSVPGPVRVGLADNRTLDCTLRPLSNGGCVLTIEDTGLLAPGGECAVRDPLTGLPTRDTVQKRLAEQMADAIRSGQDIAVLHLGLDRFKAINDTLGEVLGDALLRKVADRLKNALRAGDAVARLGGDEFAIIQSGAPQPAAATTLATRLVDLIGRAYAIEGHVLHIGTSIGVALAPGDATEPEALLKHADLALHRAKAEGRSCHRFYEPGMGERMKARRSMEVDLRRALALKELKLVYQPLFDLRTDAIMGFEALIRWSHPTRGTVSPAEFIPLAEEIGVITGIGEWVLRTACKQAAAWPVPLSIAVNLSPVQFKGGRLLETVVSTLAQSGLPASRLELEITEGALLDNAESVLKTLNQLRALGVSVSMDDFGTGYSSLSYLQNFPFDKIKIDRSFVRDIDVHADRQAIIRAVISLAGTLRMKTLAEGVETEAELACLRAEGCDQVQGYLTGRPLSSEAATALLSPVPIDTAS